MESLRYLYRIGPGPSSSHTIGPSLASEYFKNKYKDADLFKVTLHGALALTGKGHLTDKIIKKTMGKIKTEVIFDYSFLKYHPNAMIFKAYKNNKEIGTSTIYSIGGGSIVIEGDLKTKKKNVYPHKSFSEIKKYLAEEKISLVEYVKRYDVDIKDYLSIVLDTM
ncbi:MAG: serine dehydratase beta chain, partial [Erysipelotrichales bacterium]|nr:serine dehydratase beta chain [Erysipelotrichales bacterium]